jgi:hypothetical protein
LITRDRGIPPLGTTIFQTMPVKMPNFRKSFCRN